MSNWKVMKLSEVATIVGGGTPSSSKSEYFENGNIPWITPKDLSGYNKRYISKGERNITELGLKNSSAKLLPKNTVLLTSRAPIGYIAIASNEILTNQGFKSLVLNDGHIPEFFYYLLKNNVHILESRATGSTFKEISGQILKDTELSIPTPDIQQKIVDILSPLDDKIELNTQINQTLEQIAQALFKSWFVDFDPVRAKVQALSEGMSLEQAELAAMQTISGKTPEELTALSQTQPERYAELAETAKAFPCEMVEVDGGEVPKGWGVKPIELILDRLKNKQKLRKEEISFEGTIPVFEQGTSILMGYHDKDAAFNASIDEPIFIFGDHTCITKLSTIPFSIYQNVIPLIGKNLPTYWVYCAIQNKQTFQEYRRHWAELIVKEVVVPDNINLCQCFSKKVKELFFKIDINHQENRTLIETRDLLLPRLLNGEI
ncbi:restriction endonuclease subunit S [Haemophilus influenzae]|uniref:restriction endonuclease subunit S n=1 Tax=Haemophilus influenzae TaxID=727 RepID=UPI000DD4B312|nr:restriction endonuclease subunit S [Haemophilus influenzae]